MSVAQYAFRGCDLDALTDQLARQIEAARLPQLPDELVTGECDRAGAEKVLETVAAVAYSRQQVEFDRQQADLVARADKERQRWSGRVDEVERRLMLVFRLLRPGRKTVSADALREVLLAPPDQLRQMEREITTGEVSAR